MLSGASGQFYGDRYTWQFTKGWTRYVDTIGSRQMTLLVDLFARRRWFDLVPDTAHRLVVGGFDTDADSDDVNANNYVAAARTPDGKLAIAYLPAGTPIEIAMSRMAGRGVRAQWYDPTSGRYVAARGSPFATTGVRRFRTPGRNGEGDRDWVLVLTTAS